MFSVEQKQGDWTFNDFFMFFVHSLDKYDLISINFIGSSLPFWAQWLKQECYLGGAIYIT